MTVDVPRSVPPYLQIVRHFRDRILSGDLPINQRLPSTRQIATEWKVAHATAAKALATLRAEGLVNTTPGGAGGTFVRAPADDAYQVWQDLRDRMLAARRFGRIYPAGERAQIVAAEIVDPPAHVAEALGLTQGEQAIQRRRLIYRHEVPLSISTSWFAASMADAAPALLSTRRIKQGTPAYIEEQTNRVVTSCRDQQAAGAAELDVAAALGIPVGSPVLLGRHWVRDQHSEVIEYGESVTVPGQWVSYEYVVD